MTAEKTQNTNISTVEPCVICDGSDTVDTPFAITDSTAKLGFLYGVYVQDEWKITNQLTVNAGLRFDQMDEYVSANQLSPRLNVVFTPLQGTTFHAGYARNFTPPPQTIAAPVNLALFMPPANPTNTGTPFSTTEHPVLPERANVFDVGLNQVVSHGCAPAPSGSFVKAPPRVSAACESLEVGVDAYYKTAKDLLDDGQFGAALVTSGFNYEKAYNEGVELSAKYRNGDFRAYGNVAWCIQKGTNVVSHEFLIDDSVPLATLAAFTRFQYIQNNYIFTDHTRCGPRRRYLLSLVGTQFNADMIFGSGLRNNDANTTHLPAPRSTRACRAVRGLHHDAVHAAPRRREHLRHRLPAARRIGHRGIRLHRTTRGVLPAGHRVVMHEPCAFKMGPGVCLLIVRQQEGPRSMAVITRSSLRIASKSWAFWCSRFREAALATPDSGPPADRHGHRALPRDLSPWDVVSADQLVSGADRAAFASVVTWTVARQARSSC